MSLPFYVSPEQAMRDRADFARKGIGRGRGVAVVSCPQGILFVAENPSTSLRKVSEIHDRIGFAAVGRYHEFEALRVAGIRQADLRGYSYDRADVTARSLAMGYSSQLGTTFASQADKPFEVELVLAELGPASGHDVLFHISYDGTITEAGRMVALGHGAERAERAILEYPEDTDADQVLRLTAAALATRDTPLAPQRLEVGLLDRGLVGSRTFRRLPREVVESWLEGA
ncbi:MAG: proteasome subunit alpha [Arachnia sp.]